jgi:hypothetical protein
MNHVRRAVAFIWQEEAQDSTKCLLKKISFGLGTRQRGDLNYVSIIQIWEQFRTGTVPFLTISSRDVLLGVVYYFGCRIIISTGKFS